MHLCWYSFINSTLVFNKLFTLENLSITLKGIYKEETKIENYLIYHFSTCYRHEIYRT